MDENKEEIVMVAAKWCPTCKAIKEVLGEKIGRDIELIEVDQPDNTPAENIKVMQFFGIDRVPTFIEVKEENGKKIACKIKVTDNFTLADVIDRLMDNKKDFELESCSIVPDDIKI